MEHIVCNNKEDAVKILQAKKNTTLIFNNKVSRIWKQQKEE